MRAHGPGPVGSAVKIKNFLLIILLYHLLMLIMTIESYMYQLKLKSSIDKPICSYPASLCSVVPFTICKKKIPFAPEFITRNLGPTFILSYWIVEADNRTGNFGFFWNQKGEHYSILGWLPVSIFRYTLTEFSINLTKTR